jgi:hypothetical protein
MPLIAGVEAVGWLLALAAITIGAIFGTARVLAPRLPTWAWVLLSFAAGAVALFGMLWLSVVAFCDGCLS